MKYVEKNKLKVNSVLLEFINKEAIPGTDLNIDSFWEKFSAVVHHLAPINRELIEKREKIQKKIDDWHKKNKDKAFNKEEYKAQCEHEYNDYVNACLE